MKCVIEVKNAGSWASVGALLAIKELNTHDTIAHILFKKSTRDEKKNRELNYVNVQTSRSAMNEASPDWTLVYYDLP